ncbi:MAG: hypothetical protein PSX79_04135 [bacterium]|nr:hypothetical protein [bacterium]
MLPSDRKLPGDTADTLFQQAKEMLRLFDAFVSDLYAFVLIEYSQTQSDIRKTVAYIEIFQCFSPLLKEAR